MSTISVMEIEIVWSIKLALQRVREHGRIDGCGDEVGEDWVVLLNGDLSVAVDGGGALCGDGAKMPNARVPRRKTSRAYFRSFPNASGVCCCASFWTSTQWAVFFSRQVEV